MGNPNFTSGRFGRTDPPSLYPKSPICRPECNLPMQCQKRESLYALWPVAREKSGKTYHFLCIQNCIWSFFKKKRFMKYLNFGLFLRYHCLSEKSYALGMSSCNFCEKNPGGPCLCFSLNCWMIFQSTQLQVLGWEASWTYATHLKSKRPHKISKTQSRCG